MVSLLSVTVLESQSLKKSNFNAAVYHKPLGEKAMLL